MAITGADPKSAHEIWPKHIQLWSMSKVSEITVTIQLYEEQITANFCVTDS